MDRRLVAIRNWEPEKGNEGEGGKSRMALGSGLAVDKQSFNVIKRKGEESLRLGVTEGKPGVKVRRGIQKGEGKQIDVVLL